MADEIELLRLVGELIPEPTTSAWARAEAAIAAARAESLPAGRTAGDGSASAEPAHRAGRRPRRRLVLLTAAGVAAALVAGVAVLASVKAHGGRQNGSEVPVITAAYIVKRVDGALSAAEPGKIARMTVTAAGGAAVPGGGATTEEWSYGDQWRAVTYSSSGHPLYDAGLSAAAAYTLVNYPARTWARLPGMGRPAALVPGPRGCAPAVAALSWLVHPGLPGGPGFAGSSLPSTVASALRAAIACGALADAGRQRVDGTEVIELTSRPGSLIAETIWVSVSTYLPVRVTLRPAPGAPVPPRTADITWLAPSAANLAKLAVPVPTGFRQAPLAAAGKIVP